MRDRPARYITDDEARARHMRPGFVTYRAHDGVLWLVEADTFAEGLAAGTLDPDRVIRLSAPPPG